MSISKWFLSMSVGLVNSNLNLYMLTCNISKSGKFSRTVRKLKSLNYCILKCFSIIHPVIQGTHIIKLAYIIIIICNTFIIRNCLMNYKCSSCNWNLISKKNYKHDLYGIRRCHNVSYLIVFIIYIDNFYDRHFLLL